MVGIAGGAGDPNVRGTCEPSGALVIPFDGVAPPVQLGLRSAEASWPSTMQSSFELAVRCGFSGFLKGGHGGPRDARVALVMVWLETIFRHWFS